MLHARQNRSENVLCPLVFLHVARLLPCAVPWPRHSLKTRWKERTSWVLHAVEISHSTGVETIEHGLFL